MKVYELRGFLRARRAHAASSSERRRARSSVATTPLFFANVASKGVSRPVSDLESIVTTVLQTLILKELDGPCQVLKFQPFNSDH